MKRILAIISLFLVLLSFPVISVGQEHAHDHNVENEQDDHSGHDDHFWFNDSKVEMPTVVHQHTNHEKGDYLGLIADTLKYTIMITLFVLVMMLLIEYITVLTRGKWNKVFSEKNWLQIIVAAFLGLAPGCLGTYVAVSMYVHKVFGFAALVTVMIATSGDEAFIMLKVMPEEALMIMGVLFVVAITAGFLVRIFLKNKTLMVLKENHLNVHQHDDDCTCFSRKAFFPQLKNISIQRAMMIIFGLVFLAFLLSGEIGPEKWSWERIAFLVVTIIGLFIVLTVPDHFLEKHLWGHVIKKHFLKIFLWTFFAFLAINIFKEYLDIESLLRNNMFYVLLVAVLIGIIPESGPHIFFIALYLGGYIPISILIANSIVQDGHGALPLFAESRRSFVVMKIVNMLFGLIAGLVGYFFGF